MRSGPGRHADARSDRQRERPVRPAVADRVDDARRDPDTDGRARRGCDPAADTTSLVTTIETLSRGPALEQLNALVEDEGFTCYTPDGGTRCEKTWDNPDYPVTDGRTLFWRADLMIDTRYSNLAPTGYTSSVITSIWGED